MRENKYKFYHENMKKMGVVLTLSLNDDGIFAGHVDFGENVSKSVFSIEGSWLQYTGLKDKNGVEIYEGDIVRHYDVIDWPCAFGVVGYHVIEAQWELWSDPHWEDRGTSCKLPETIECNYEVIGNIHENKDLLK